jgi:hypothetical protein
VLRYNGTMENYETEPQKKSHLGLWVLLFIFLLLIIVAGTLAFFIFYKPATILSNDDFIGNTNEIEETLIKTEVPISVVSGATGSLTEINLELPLFFESAYTLDDNLYITTKFDKEEDYVFDGTTIQIYDNNPFNDNVFKYDEKYYSKQGSSLSVLQKNGSWKSVADYPKFPAGIETYQDTLYLASQYDNQGPSYTYDDKNGLQNLSVCEGYGGFNTIKVHQGYLYAAPRGCEKDVCRYDGSIWECVADTELWVKQLIPYKDELILFVGSLNPVYSYDGEETKEILSLPFGTPNDIEGFVVHKDKLYAYSDKTNPGIQLREYDGNNFGAVELVGGPESIDVMISFKDRLYIFGEKKIYVLNE